MQNSIMLNTDSYKVSMWKQYPQGTEYVYSYIESRGGDYNRAQFLGIQAFAREMAIPITQADINRAEKVWAAHGEQFNRAGWQYILDVHSGRLPLRIRAAKEGLVIPTKNVLCTIENTDPECYWLTTWVETAALRAIWYPTTVGTKSWYMKQEILAYLNKSGTPESIMFKLHDFGARGVSSEQSAGIGAAAHLVNFRGTDTISGVLHIEDVYGDVAAGGSIPAAEHSTITSWGRENEKDAYANMVKQFGTSGAIFAVVSDSYDIYKACEMWGDMKDQIVASGATLVVRPDSGDPVVVIPRILNILQKRFGSVKNDKGYAVLNNVRVIWGDGINSRSVSTILRTVVDVFGYSADNIAFGMGGGLLQQLDRDTLKFAMKCSAIGIRQCKEGRIGWSDNTSGTEVLWRDVFKDPITDSGKISKKGRVVLFESGGEYVTDIEENLPKHWTDKGTDWKDCMETYFENGMLQFTQTFEQVRNNSEL